MEIGLVLVGKEVLEMRNRKTQKKTSGKFHSTNDDFHDSITFLKNSIIHRLLIL